MDVTWVIRTCPRFTSPCKSGLPDWPSRRFSTRSRHARPRVDPVRVRAGDGALAARDHEVWRQQRAGRRAHPGGVQARREPDGRGGRPAAPRVLCDGQDDEQPARRGGASDQRAGGRPLRRARPARGHGRQARPRRLERVRRRAAAARRVRAANPNPSPNPSPSPSLSLSLTLTRCERTLEGVSLLGELSTRTRDRVVSYGERCSGR